MSRGVWAVFLVAILGLVGVGGTPRPLGAASSGTVSVKLSDIPVGKVIQVGGMKFVKVGNDQYQAVNLCPIGSTYQAAYKGCVVKTTNFAYTGGEQTFTAPASGYYVLEVWGAQGGGYSTTYAGGYGGYSHGVIQLNSNEKLYVMVGGKGGSTTSDSSTTLVGGGYNGGGDSRCGGGGGATHIATVGGLLSSLSSTTNQAKVLIVAGGGGGTAMGWKPTSYQGYGGHAGGYSGGSGHGSSNGKCMTSGACGNPGTGGGQTTPGTGGNGESKGANGKFGEGGSGGNGSDSGGGAGGGGGWYGGGGGGDDATRCDGGGGGGGSGYVNTAKLISGSFGMYCYSGSNPKTTIVCGAGANSTSGENVNEVMTANNAKIGDGAARITQLSVYLGI